MTTTAAHARPISPLCQVGKSGCAWHDPVHETVACAVASPRRMPTMAATA